MLARMHPDFEWRPLEASPIARVYRGREQVRRYVEDWLRTFESIPLDLEDPTEVADLVVAVVRGHGRGRASGLELERASVKCGPFAARRRLGWRSTRLARRESPRCARGGTHVDATRARPDTQSTILGTASRRPESSPCARRSLLPQRATDR
jgi:hypothetical protein